MLRFVTDRDPLEATHVDVAHLPNLTEAHCADAYTF
jgi:hypothetical protein